MKWIWEYKTLNHTSKRCIGFTCCVVLMTNFHLVPQLQEYPGRKQIKQIIMILVSCYSSSMEEWVKRSLSMWAFVLEPLNL
jgi:hypothetical protein